MSHGLCHFFANYPQTIFLKTVQHLIIIIIKHTQIHTKTVADTINRVTHNQLTTSLKVIDRQTCLTFECIISNLTSVCPGQVWWWTRRSLVELFRLRKGALCVHCYLHEICWKGQCLLEEVYTHAHTHTQTLRHWGSNCVHLLLFIG